MPFDSLKGRAKIKFDTYPGTLVGIFNVSVKQKRWALLSLTEGC